MAVEEEKIEEEKIEEEVMPPPSSPVEKGYSGIGFAFALVAGILILIGAGVMLAIIPLIATVLPWAELDPQGQIVPGIVGTALTVLAALSIVFGIVIIVADIIFVRAGKKFTGGLIILILSIISLFGGGGFILGSILGIIGGALILRKK